MTARGDRHAAAAGSFHALFWCALGKMACATAIVVIERISTDGDGAPVAAFLATLAVTACLVMLDWAYISRLTAFSPHPKWITYSRIAGVGAIATLVGLAGLFIGAVMLSVFAPLGWSAGVTVGSRCAMAGAIAAATGIFMFYIATIHMGAICALVYRSRTLVRSAGYVLRCFWALLGAAPAAGIIALLVGTFAGPGLLRILADMVTLAAQGFALYCMVVHLMLLIRTAGVLDLAATDDEGG